MNTNTKEYQEGLAAGDRGASPLDNPYAKAASLDNIRSKLGFSPWWDTNYIPFLEWERGRSEANLKRLQSMGIIR